MQSSNSSDPAVIKEYPWSMRSHFRASADIAVHSRAGRVLGPLLRALPFVALVSLGAAYTFGAASLTEAIGVGLPAVFLPVLWHRAFLWLWALPGIRVVRRTARLVPLERRAVSPAGLDVAGPAETAFWPWKRIVRVAESSEFFLFYTDSGEAQYVPKHLLDEQERRTVRSLIAATGLLSRPRSDAGQTSTTRSRSSERLR